MEVLVSSAQAWRNAAWCSKGFYFPNGCKSKCYCRYAVKPLKKAEINSVMVRFVPPVVFDQSFTVCQYFFETAIFLYFFYLFVYICYDSLAAHCLWRLRVLREKIPIFCQWQVPNQKYSHVRWEVHQKHPSYTKSNIPGNARQTTKIC